MAAIVPHVVIFVKIAKTTPVQNRNPYHVGGLAANGLHTVTVLKELGINAELQTVLSYDEVAAFMAKNKTITVAVIEAVWMTVEQTVQLGKDNPQAEIVVRAHSKIGFLQVEPEAVPVMRGLITTKQKNVFFASNNKEFAETLADVYGKCLYLPNLYDVEGAPPKMPTSNGTIRIASFGASRLLKLHPTAALAALQIARELQMNLEFYVNSDSTPGGHGVRNTIRNMFDRLTWAKMIEVPWQDPATFRGTIASMDLVMQLSATETFCIVAADAVASGVPVVVSPAITWVNKEYQVDNVDDTSHVARLGARIFLVRADHVAKTQLKSLNKFLNQSRNVWLEFLHLPVKKNWFGF